MKKITGFLRHLQYETGNFWPVFSLLLTSKPPILKVTKGRLTKLTFPCDSFGNRSWWAVEGEGSFRYLKTYGARMMRGRENKPSFTEPDIRLGSCDDSCWDASVGRVGQCLHPIPTNPTAQYSTCGPGTIKRICANLNLFEKINATRRLAPWPNNVSL